MKKMVVAFALAMATLTTTATGAWAAATVYEDSDSDVKTYKGSPSTAQKYQAEITKVSVWKADGRFYVRWSLKDLRSDYRFPRLEFRYSDGYMTGGEIVVQAGNAATSSTDYSHNCSVSAASISYAYNYVSVSVPIQTACTSRYSTLTKMDGYSVYKSTSGYTWTQDYWSAGSTTRFTL